MEEMNEIITVLKRARVVYQVPSMEPVYIWRDLLYKTDGERDLHFDVYYPSTVEHGTPHPAVIFLPWDGEAAMLADQANTPPTTDWGKLIASEGLIAITAKPRPVIGLENLYDVAGDIDDLFRCVARHGERLSIDTDALGIWACSSEALFALRAALRDTAGPVRCLVSYYGPTDLQGLAGEAALTAPRQLLEDFSLAHYLGRNPTSMAPLQVVKAAHDSPALNASIDRFIEQAAQLNTNVTLLVNTQGAHGFDAADGKRESRECIKTSLEFIKRHLAKWP